MNLLKASFLLVFGFASKLVFVFLTDRMVGLNLGPENYGTFKYFVTLITIFSSIAAMGFNSSIVHTVAVHRADKPYLRNIFRKSFIIIFISSSATMLLLYSPDMNPILKIGNRDVFIIMISGVFMLTFNHCFVGIYSSFKKVLPKVLLNDFFYPLLFLAALYIAFSRTTNLSHVAGIYISLLFLLFIVNGIVVLIILKDETDIFKLTRNIKIIRFYKYTYPIFFTAILIALSTNIDKIVLGQMFSKHELGIYYSAFTLSSVLNFILTSLLFIYLPVASQLFASQEKKLAGLLNSYISKWLMLVSFPPFWLLIYYAENVIVFVYGQTFAEGTFVLQLLSLAAYINVSLGFTGQTLLAIGDSFNQMLIRIIGIVFGFAMAVVLGSLCGLHGVALSVLFSFIITNALQIFKIRYKHNVSIYGSTNLKCCLTLLLSIVSILIFHQSVNIASLIIQYTLDIIIFLIFVIGMKTLDKKDYKILLLINENR